MKKVICVMIGAFLVVVLAGCTTTGPSKGAAKEGLAAKSEPGPTVVVVTPRVKMSKKATITIKGTGFKPGQEVELLFTAVDGVQSDIGYALKPKPVADKTGTWVTTWSCGRFISKKLIKEGTYTITVTDVDYNSLAEAPVAFFAEK